MMRSVTLLLRRNRWPLSPSSPCSTRHQSTFNYRESVNENKENARRLVLLENLHHQPDIKAKIGNVDKEFLSDKLDANIDKFWTWSYHRRSFFLLQLNSVEDIAQLKEKCGFNLHSFPVKTRMIEASFDLPSEKPTTPSHERFYEFVSSQAKRPLLVSELKKKYTSAQMIEYLTTSNSLTELDIQLRYFLITQIEDILCQGIFSGFHIYPFGSSLAGLGDSTSDLDICMLHGNLQHLKGLNFSMPEVKSDRDQTQQSLCIIADIMRHFLPNFSQINRILRARVPIVRTTFDLAPIDMDISIELSQEAGHHGFMMARYISYSLSVDPLVKQFFVILKTWARQHGVVRSMAGNWFTNFQVITLAIFFLQSKNILQSMETYDGQAPASNVSLPHLHRLLYEFFEFLISFNFEKEALSILQAKTISKPDFSPIYIENPLERNLNICKNINGVEFKKLMLVAYNSLDAMHNEQFHLADLLDAEYFKQLEKQSQSS